MNSSLALFSIRMDMVFIEVASQPYRYYIHISLKLHDQIPCPRYIANFGIPICRKHFGSSPLYSPLPMSSSAREKLAQQLQESLSNDHILQGISQELGIAQYFGCRIWKYRQTLLRLWFG